MITDRMELDRIRAQLAQLEGPFVRRADAGGSGATTTGGTITDECFDGNFTAGSPEFAIGPCCKSLEKWRTDAFIKEIVGGIGVPYDLWNDGTKLTTFHADAEKDNPVRLGPCFPCEGTKTEDLYDLVVTPGVDATSLSVMELVLRSELKCPPQSCIRWIRRGRFQCVSAMKFELDFFQDVPPSFTRCPIVQPVAAEDAFPPEPGIPAYIDVTIDGYDGFCDTNFNRWMLKYDQAAFPPFLPEIHVDVNVGTVRCHYSQTGGGGHLYVSDDVLVGTIAGVEYFRPVRAELISGAGFATVRVSSDTINVPAQTTHHILGVGGDCDASVQPEDVACFWATPHRLQAGHNSFVPVCSLGLTDGMIDVAAGPFPPGALDGCDEIDTFGLRVDSGHCLPCPAP